MNQPLGGPQSEEIFYDEIDSINLEQPMDNPNDSPGLIGEEHVTVYGTEEPVAPPPDQLRDEFDDPVAPQLDYIPPAPPGPSPTEYQLHQQLVQERKAAMNEKLNAAVNQQSSEVAKAFYQHLIDNEGYDKKQALELVGSQAELYRDALATSIKQAVTARQEDNQAKVIVAQTIGQAFNIDPNSLMPFDSPEKMHAAASQIAGQVNQTAAENYRLRRENQMIRSRRVPTQQYNRSGRVRGGFNEDQLIDQYNNGIETPQTVAAVRKRYGL